MVDLRRPRPPRACSARSSGAFGAAMPSDGNQTSTCTNRAFTLSPDVGTVRIHERRLTVLGLRRTGDPSDSVVDDKGWPSSPDCVVPTSDFVLPVPSAHMVRRCQPRPDAVSSKRIRTAAGVQLPPAQVAETQDDGGTAHVAPAQSRALGKPQDGSGKYRFHPQHCIYRHLDEQT